MDSTCEDVKDFMTSSSGRQMHVTHVLLRENGPYAMFGNESTETFCGAVTFLLWSVEAQPALKYLY
eukprot:CCRYP_007992-RA/>CCRYP_007992-RA protein AED:0.00 eAED:0.00 QI:1156/1/1/1/0/0/2/61/65